MNSGRRIMSVLTVILLIFSFSSCGEEEKKDCVSAVFSVTGGNLAAYVYVEPSTITEEEEKSIREKEKAAANIFEENYRYLTDSNPYIAEINSGTTVLLDIDGKFIDTVSEIFELSEKTKGAFQPAGGAYTLALRSGEEGNLSHVGTDKFSFEEGTVKKSDGEAKLDFYAASTGYAMNAATAAMAEAGLSHFRLSCGSVTALYGAKLDGTPFITDIFNGDELVGYLNLTDGFVSVIDENSETYDFDGTPGDFSLVAVYGIDGTETEAVANAVFSMTEDEISALYDSKSVRFEAVGVLKDGSVMLTPGLCDSGLYISAEDAAEMTKDAEK